MMRKEGCREGVMEMDFRVVLAGKDYPLHQILVTDVRPKMVYEDNKVTDRQETDGKGNPVYRLHFMVTGEMFGASDFWANYTDTDGTLKRVSAPFTLKMLPLVLGHTYGARSNNVTFSIPTYDKSRLVIGHELSGNLASMFDDGNGEDAVDGGDAPSSAKGARKA